MILNSSYPEQYTTYYETVEQTFCPIVFAQRFTAIKGTLSRSIFRIHKAGSPEGTLTAKLYATSGSNPSTLLTSSTGITVESISSTPSSGDANMVEFFFDGTTKLTPGVKYFIGVEVDLTSANSSNYVEFGASTTSFPRHPEQMAIYDGCTTTWSLTTADAIFYVYTKNNGFILWWA
jgi:hypothetical protein